MTRAQDRLFLTRALVRRQFGSEMPDDTEPSRFLSEIPKELIEDLSPRHRMRAKEMYAGPVYNSAENIRDFFAKRGAPPVFHRKGTKAAKEDRPEPGLKIGGRVRHAKYGIGTVLRREGAGDGAKLTISFPGYGLKKLVEKYAGLEKA
jgi:DNA helicase-2/ATP-dependent DNA helicase PcrA